MLFVCCSEAEWGSCGAYSNCWLSAARVSCEERAGREREGGGYLFGFLFVSNRVYLFVGVGEGRWGA